MSRWEKSEICTLCKINIGKTPSRENTSYWKNGTHDWMTISDLSEKYICNTKEKITHEAVSECRMQAIPANTVVMSFKLSLGKVGITRKSMFSNEAIASFSIIDKNKLCENFLYYALRTLQFENADRAAKGVTLNKSKLNHLVIPVPPLKVQHQIANELDTVSELLSLQERQLDDLDQLAQSVFYEMFGDPVTNPLGWVTEPLDKHADILAGYPFDSSQYSQSGIKICGGLIIMPDRIAWENANYWHSSDGLEKYLLSENDIVLAMDRPWISTGLKIGQISQGDLPALLIQRTARIRAIDINPSFIKYMINSRKFELHCKVTETTVPHISIKDIKNFHIFIPPFELQNKFAEIVTKIESQKSLVKQSIDETQRLFDSLMSKYFDD